MRILIRKTIKMIPAAFICLVLAPGRPWAISNNYAQVLIENLRIGNTYSMSELANMPLIIGNSNLFPTKIKIEVISPDPAKLKSGFESLPDLSWISLGESIVTVPAQGEIKTDVKIKIPKKKALLGKKYQVSIRATEMREATGVVVNFSVAGQLLFTIAPVRGSGRAQNKVKTELNLNFTLDPDRLYANDVAVGEQVEVLTGDKKSFQVSNPNDSELTLRIVPLAGDDPMLEIEPEYEVLKDPSCIILPESTLVLPPKTRQEYKISVRIPDGEEHAGKKYQFFVSFSMGGVQTGTRIMRVFISTKPAAGEGGDDKAGLKTADENEPEDGKVAKTEAAPSTPDEAESAAGGKNGEQP